MRVNSLPIYPARIRGKLHHSLPQSIISDPSRYDAWFHSNYIQLFCNKGTRGSFPLNFYEYFVWDHPFPFIQVHKMNRDTLKLFAGDLLEFIVKCVDNGLYFYVYVDEFYIPLLLFQRRHYVHDLMIYGYDLDAREFDVVGMTQNSQLGTAKISFDQFLESYHASEITEEYHKDVFLLREKPNPKYEFDITLVRELLEDYILSRNTSERFRMVANPMDCWFGMDVYEQYLEDMRLAKETNEFISYLPIHQIFEHKSCMLGRMEYMRDHGHVDPEKMAPIIESYRAISQKANVLRNMILKRQRTGSDPTVDQLIEKIEQLRDGEREVLPEFLRILKEQAS